MKFPKSELWDFSTQTYQIPEVEQACLNLQNNFGADVNILLYCCWTGEKQLPLSAAQIQLLVQTTDPWQNSILKPLRSARNAMKKHIIAMPPDLLEQTLNNMQQMEINAEHMEQQALEKAIDTGELSADSRAAVEVSAANLSLYLLQLDSVDSISEVSADLTRLLDALYQDAEAIQMALMSAAV